MSFLKDQLRKQLEKEFGFGTTDGWWDILKVGELSRAEEFLGYVSDNPLLYGKLFQNFPAWLADRQEELRLAKEVYDGTLPWEMSKQDGIDDLSRQTGIGSTAEFRQALAERHFMDAARFIGLIAANRLRYVQYVGPWERFLADRRAELDKAKAAAA